MLDDIVRQMVRECSMDSLQKAEKILLPVSAIIFT